MITISTIHLDNNLLVEFDKWIKFIYPYRNYFFLGQVQIQTTKIMPRINQSHHKLDSWFFFWITLIIKTNIVTIIGVHSNRNKKRQSQVIQFYFLDYAYKRYCLLIMNYEKKYNLYKKKYKLIFLEKIKPIYEINKDVHPTK